MIQSQMSSQMLIEKYNYNILNILVLEVCVGRCQKGLMDKRRGRFICLIMCKEAPYLSADARLTV